VPPKKPIRGNPRGTDRRLLDRIAEQDRQAFETFYYLYYTRLSRFLRRFKNDDTWIDEVVNDVMFVIWQKAGAFQGRSRASTWVFGIAYRRAMKALQGKGNLHDELDESNAPTYTEDPAASIDRERMRGLVQDAVKQLGAKHMAVVQLTYFDGFSCAEVAEIVGCPTNTVKTRMFHARKRLKEILHPTDFGVLSSLTQEKTQ